LATKMRINKTATFVTALRTLAKMEGVSERQEAPQKEAAV